jgi:hypothetical protein
MSTAPATIITSAPISRKCFRQWLMIIDSTEFTMTYQAIIISKPLDMLTLLQPIIVQLACGRTYSCAFGDFLSSSHEAFAL